MRIRNGFEEFFSLRSNLSYDNIYFFLKARSENGYGFYGSGLEKRVWKMTFLGLK